ncbi:MAG: tetrathionate reductase family octaheme c-type cytochrome [Rhodobacteraceae bacterium]|nr:tetrathionate reductase family octaheme c-type cytochrome [Paracoccaceae bacterium]
MSYLIKTVNACIFLVLVSFPVAAVSETGAPATIPASPPAISTDSTADHSTFRELKQSFASGPDVTKACLSCHTEADDQVMHSIHYQWNYASQSGQQLGKSNVVNSFCGNVASNEARCTSCHAGYGWDDMAKAPSSSPEFVDCLVCHDRSGQYTKTATGAGHPPLDPVRPGTKTITGALAWPVDLSRSAQSVGMPGRDNCGNCHFYGGGGDNVKHGDLSSVLYAPSEAVDVHMASDGLNFTCQECHVSESHEWAGSRYDVAANDTEGTGLPGQRRQAATCESCHESDPHPLSLTGIKLNDHTNKVACQTCHIPTYARGGVATKTVWDWSTAGRLGPEGQPIAMHDYTQSDGQELHTYLSQKGDFDWGENVEPYYAFFDGAIEYTLPGEQIDPTQVVEINRISGAYNDPDSRIWPFKLMEGRQAYDSGLNRLAYSHVWGPTTETAFWTNFDWGEAIEAGMTAAGAEYSGEYGFVDTNMYWPITHMVAPASEALACAECHGSDGRLSELDGFYLPGSNPTSLAGLAGMAMVLATALGVAFHAAIRLLGRRRRKEVNHD